ncbi:MAG: hypothetical protein ACI4P5_06015 [Candidatus Fimadaptatus sp.]
MPWSWLLYRALDMGISASDFWRMSPRAVIVLLRRLRRTQTPAQPGPVRLSYIPRP